MRYDKLVEGLLDGLAAGKTEQQISDKHGVSIKRIMQALKFSSSLLRLPISPHPDIQFSITNYYTQIFSNFPY